MSAKTTIMTFWHETYAQNFIDFTNDFTVFAASVAVSSNPATKVMHVEVTMSEYEEEEEQAREMLQRYVTRYMFLANVPKGLT